MLRSLHISNYILIDSLDVKFPEGLVIITGQTGAGKSILLGALSLVGGSKADASMVGPSGDNCVVEAEYGLPDDSLKTVIEDAGAEWQEGELILRRVLSSSGRSRCFVNDCPVPLQTLQEISAALVDIHSQHNSLLLTSSRFQMGVLDSYSSNGGLLGDCASLWENLQKLRKERETLSDRLARYNADNDYNAAQFRQLDQAALREGELEELEAEHKTLAHAGQIKDSLGAAIQALSPEDGDGVVSALREAGKQLEQTGSFVAGISPLSERLDSARIEIDDICREIDRFYSSVELNPARLQEVEDRMSLLYSLLRKHSCSSVSELISLRDSLSESLSGPESVAERLEEVEKEITALQKEYDGICAALHKSRTEHAPEFSKSISDSIHYLELDGAVFETRIEECAPGPYGTDSLKFFFSSNGTAPVELSRCASGGELSRIMLCLKSLMAEFANMPTLVFDEIDTGVSGSVADKMGRMICAMGERMQVVSITHLPQVAAKGNAHFVVEKSAGPDGRVRSTLRRLSGEDRTMEIARLLSGSTITPQAIANAKSLQEGC